MSDNVTVIKPLEGPMRGSTRVPGDKSISHRAVLFSAMAEGTSRVSGVLDSADVRSSIGAVRALGAQVSLEKQADGTYKLNGVKRFISNAGYDGPCVLFALQKDEESGKDLVTGLVIDKFCEGYSISSPWEKIGYRGSEVYDIFLDDVKVTEDQILGKPGDGFTQLLGTTAYGKLGFTAVFVGTALGAADIALKYCQEKLHRGKSITKFPTTQLRLSTMLTYAHTAELLLLEAADYCDHNHFAGDDIPTMRAVQARTAQAKGYAAETATKVATMAVNAMGAYGVCDEYQAERFLRDAAVAPNIEGSGDIQYLIHGMYVAANGNTN